MENFHLQLSDSLLCVLFCLHDCFIKTDTMLLCISAHKVSFMCAYTVTICVSGQNRIYRVTISQFNYSYSMFSSKPTITTCLLPFVIHIVHSPSIGANCIAHFHNLLSISKISYRNEYHRFLFIHILLIIMPFVLFLNFSMFIFESNVH